MNVDQINQLKYSIFEKLLDWIKASKISNAFDSNFNLRDDRELVPVSFTLTTNKFFKRFIFNWYSLQKSDWVFKIIKVIIFINQLWINMSTELKEKDTR